MTAITKPRIAARDHLRLLGIYLNDHLAGSTAGLNLARRLAGEHRGTTAGEALAAFAAEVAEDRAALLGIMHTLGVPISRVKASTALVVERLSRLKLNGRLLGRSPLSSLVELESMRLGVEGKAAGWRALSVVASRDVRLDPQQLEVLLVRARRQAELLDGLHAQAAEGILAAT
ncbi:MAG: hypothetical protein JWM18_5045 [Chloroflexi bacterium]|jgi:hypothetical protein|nr:hypothetical protein [Chloroflexota bacterium]